MSTYEFDSTYSALTGEHVGGIYIPTAESDPDYDVTLDGQIDTEWYFLTGYTRQYGYRGAVMHASETMTDDAIREAVREAGGDVFAIVTVEAPCECDDSTDCVRCSGGYAEPAGWAVIYREAPLAPATDPEHHAERYSPDLMPDGDA